MEFEQNILVHIYYDGIILLNEEDKYFEIKLNISEFENYLDEKCEVLKYKIEHIMKEDLVKKLKSKICNVVEVSRKYNIPVKYLLNTLFLNNRMNHIEIIWSPSAIKEFQYVPMKHYLEYRDDSLVLRVKGIKFQNKID
jgi:hypothetical protein